MAAAAPAPAGAALATPALLTGRRAISTRGLALAAAVVLLLQPAAVLGASFQMSFAAVMALIAGWEWLRPRLPSPEKRWKRRLAVALFGTVATSVLAGAATTPLACTTLAACSSTAWRPTPWRCRSPPL